jgi:hypothetical protein
MLDNVRRFGKSSVGDDRSPSGGTFASAGVLLAKGICPLGRQRHRPSRKTASLRDEGVLRRLVA